MNSRSANEIEMLAMKAYEMVKKNDLEGIRHAIQDNPWLVRHRYWFGNTLLHEACWNNSAEMVELLISLGADVNAKTNEGSPPITDAIYQKASLKTIQVLLNNKADLDYQGHYAGPLYWANINCGQDVVEALLKAGARYRANEVFQHAVMHGNEKLVDILIEYQISVDSQDHDGNALLTWAACNISDERHYRIATKLLALKADVNIKDNYGHTPLYWAISSQFKSAPLLDLAKLYLDHGAKLDIKGHYGVTPLLYAAQYSELSMMQLLTTKITKSDLAHKDNDKNTILHYAAQNWKKGVCQYFIEQGLDVNAKNIRGETPLLFACKSHKYENAIALLNAGAKADIKDSDGKSPLGFLENDRDSKYSPFYNECLAALEKSKLAEKETAKLEKSNLAMNSFWKRESSETRSDDIPSNRVNQSPSC